MESRTVSAVAGMRDRCDDMVNGELVNAGMLPSMRYRSSDR